MSWQSTNATILGACFVLTVGSARVARAGPPTDACSLLRGAQVSSVLGVSVAAGKPLFPGTTKVCGWPPPGGPTPPKRVLVTLIDAQNWAYVKMPVGHGIVKTPVSGIGDDAIYGTTPGLGTELSVKKGNTAFSVHIYGFPPDELQTMEKTLAHEILAKL
jgi:hypothetical protein